MNLALRSHFLGELPWSEVAEILASPLKCLMVPIGSTEAHGPHLPLNVDAVVATECARRAAATLTGQGTPTVIAPTIPYVVTDVAGPFAGTVGLTAETATRLFAEVIGHLAGQGFDRIVVANGHFEPAHVETLEAALARVRSATGAAIAFPDWRLTPYKERLSEISPEFGRGARHAGAYETSMILAAAPRLVREKILPTLTPVWIDLPAAINAGARTFKEAGASQAYFGDPSTSSVALGEKLLETLTGTLVDAAKSLF